MPLLVTIIIIIIGSFLIISRRRRITKVYNDDDDRLNSYDCYCYYYCLVYNWCTCGNAMMEKVCLFGGYRLMTWVDYL